MKTKILFLTILFIICNWLMDISNFWLHRGECAGNGIIQICDNFLMYHIFWYISIIIFVYIIYYINKNEKTN
jgi:hypothetical protein